MKLKNMKGVKRDQLFFEDVEAGRDIPPFKTPPFWQAQQAMFGAVVGTWCPVFFSERYAKEEAGISTPLVIGIEMTVILGQYMTDWIGPNGVLKKLSNRERNPVFIGNSLITKGKVVKKYVKDGENYIDCEIVSTTQDGLLINQERQPSHCHQKTRRSKLLACFFKFNLN